MGWSKIHYSTPEKIRSALAKLARKIVLICHGRKSGHHWRSVSVRTVLRLPGELDNLKETFPCLGPSSLQIRTCL